MFKQHILAAADFDTLAAGFGSASTIVALRAAQFSRRLVGLRAVLDAAERTGHGEAAGIAAGVDLLIRAERQDPLAVASVIGYPFIGSWVGHCLRLLSRGPAADIVAGLGHLRGIAAAAAIQAKLPFSIEVPVQRGAVSLPALGSMLVPAGEAATVRSDGTATTVGTVPLAGGSGWQELRRWRWEADGRLFSVVLDDIDPFRGGPGLPLAPRLEDAAAAGWERLLREAWQTLARDHGGYADAIGAVPLVLTPLIAAQRNRGINATSRESFGAIAVSEAPDPILLANVLVHEYQHAKLYALLNLISLYRNDQARYYAPWREDPRPLGGLLHGAYAYLAVSDFWRVQRTVSGTPHADYAQMEFARWSDRARRTVEAMLRSGSLTESGERFVGGMRERMRTWPPPEPAEPLRIARKAAADHRLCWRLRNSRPAPAAVTRLAQAWLSGDPPPRDGAGDTEYVDGGAALGVSHRIDLLHMRIRDPDALAREFAAGSAGGRPATGGWSRADLFFAAGEMETAAAAYRLRIQAAPGYRDAWAGLALALAGTGAAQHAYALLNAPELVYAVFHRVLEVTGRAPDPEAIASWLTSVVPADPELCGLISDQEFPSRIR